MFPTPVLFMPVALQALAMSVDEGVLHRRRGLTNWERCGHPLDALYVSTCYAWLLAHTPGDERALAAYAALAALSCILITKDEFVHARACGPFEHWLHAVLFVLHPIVLGAFGWAWWLGNAGTWLALQCVLTVGFAAYQWLYWSRRCPSPR